MTGAVKTTCPYCGVGCGVVVGIGEDGNRTVVGDRDHPANFGRLCSKGAALGETLDFDGRLSHPLVGGRREDWDTALDTVAHGFSQTIRDHGPDSIAFYVSGQLLTEDYYVANKLMKGLIGSANIDTNSRLCMASSVAGHRRAFGFDTVPGCYEDIELADLVVLVGSNAAWCHPVLYQRLARARDQRGIRVIVIDPRRTATCEIADLHLPIRPGTDVLLFNGLLADLARRGCIDEAFVGRHTSGFDRALDAAHKEAADVDTVATGCGLDRDDVWRLFTLFASTEKSVTVYSQGVNQSVQGTDKVNAIINCHLATGRIGRPGMGPFSATGQPNAMGGREVGGLANQLAAHMGFATGDVERVRRFWNAPNIARREGLKAVDMFRAVEKGTIKAIWIMATNPAVSLPEAERARRALRNCDFVVVSECMRETDTSAFADVMLPAATWGEKDGTVTNSERRISRQRAFMDPPGEARPDWWIVTEVARRMGFGRAFPYRKPVEIFREHAALSAFKNAGSRVFDIGGLADITEASYDRFKPVQWPVKQVGGGGTARLYADGSYFTPDRRARFVAVRTMETRGSVDPGYPLILNSGRVRDQWHTMTRTGKSPRLSSHEPEPFVEVNPADAKAFSIDDGALVRVSSRTGAVVARARVTATQRRGGVFVPMHWNDRFAGQCVLGRAVHAITDPISGQPDSKATPVRLKPYPVAWSGFLITRHQNRPEGIAYWTRRIAPGCHIYELAGSEWPESPDGWAHGLLGIGNSSSVLRYQDSTQGVYRWARLTGDRLDACLFVTRTSGLPGRDWLEVLFRETEIDELSRRALLSGEPPKGAAREGRTVCACFGVGIDRLIAAIAGGGLTTVEAVGGALKAGTNCGSCIPEIKSLLADARRHNAA